MKKTEILFFILMVSSICCSAQFEDITARAGLRHNCATSAIMGGGATFIDYNLDGWLDLVFTGGESPDKLYKNNGDGTFDDNSHLISRHNESDITTGVLSGDLNGDGCPDLLFTTWNDDGIDFILTNDCDGGFVLESENTLFRRASAMGATLYDFNQDGFLDIYISNYVEEARFLEDSNSEVIGFDHVPARNYLYINEGDMTFSEQSLEFGLESRGCALGVTVIPTPDKSGRGLYIANDFGEWVHPNEFFEFGETLPYQDRAPDYGLDIGIYSMGIAIGDFNNDLNFDLYVTNLGANALLVNNGSQYIDKAADLNVENELAPDGLFATSWGTFFFDVNNDGWQDLFVSNGFINSPDFIETSFIDPDQLYLNRNQGELFDRADFFNVDNPGINRGAICGDIDNDGDIDILTAYVNFEASDNPDRHYKLYQNNTVNENFIDIDLVATSTASDAFGSIVDIKTDQARSIAYKYSGGTHSSQNSPFVHVGMGTAEIIDSLEIFWPSLNTTSTLTDIPANSRIRITENIEGYEILGCTDSDDPAYDPNATLDYGCSPGLVSTKNVDNAKVDFSVRYNDFEIAIGAPETATYSFKLIDMSGRCLSASSHPIKGSHSMRVGSLPPGTYIVSIVTSVNQYSYRIVIIE